MKARRAYVCFLEREVYAFFDERVRGVMLRARIFLFMGGSQKTTWAAGDGPAADGHRRHARMAAGRATQEERRMRDAREKGRRLFFFFLGKDWRVVVSGGSRSRSTAIAALGYRHRCENGADCGTGWARDPACRGLRPVAAVPAYPAYRP